MGYVSMDEFQRTCQTEKLAISNETKMQFCLQCGNEYEAKLICIGSGVRDLSSGLCYKCRGKHRHDEKEQAKLATQQARLSLISRCGIPLKFSNDTFDNFDQSRPGNVNKAYRRCLDYASKFPVDYRSYIKTAEKPYPSLVLFSKMAGLGKTHLAVSICKNIIGRWNEDLATPVMFVTESDLLGRIQNTYSYSQEERGYRENEEDIIKLMIYRPLLVLDEVGYERRTELRFVRRILFRIINGRYNNRVPVVITTNLNTHQLKNYLDGSTDSNTDEAERTFDRLYEMTGGKFFEVEGESYRRTKGK